VKSKEQAKIFTLDSELFATRSQNGHSLSFHQLLNLKVYIVVFFESLMDRQIFNRCASSSGGLNIQDFAVAFCCKFGYLAETEIEQYFGDRELMTYADWESFLQARAVQDDERDLFLALDTKGKGYLSASDIEDQIVIVLPHMKKEAFRIALTNAMGNPQRVTYSHFRHVVSQINKAL
jgi:hypothetical protein